MGYLFGSCCNCFGFTLAVELPQDNGIALTDEDEVDYETTARNEPFKGTEVSRKSVAALIVKIIASPELTPRSNLGVNKPNTDGDKPTFL